MDCGLGLNLKGTVRRLIDATLKTLHVLPIIVGAWRAILDLVQGRGNPALRTLPLAFSLASGHYI